MRERLLMPTLTMVVVITSLISSLGGPIIPQMVTHFGVSLQEAQWVLTLPLLVGAVVSPLLGRLGVPGRQRSLLLICLGLVSIGLLLSALPLGFVAMLIGRALQGIGMALAPIAMSITRGVLGPEASLSAIAILSSATVAAAGLSFPLSALFAGVAGIAGVYWVGFALAVVTLLLVWFSIPRETKAPAVAVDWWGALILAGGSGALLLLLSQIHSWSPITSLIVAIVSVLLTGLWLVRSLRIAEPLIDLRLAANPRVAVAHLTILIAGAGTYLMLPLVIIAGQDETAAGLPSMFVGFLLIPYSVFAVAGARIGNRLRGVLSLTQLLLIGSIVYILASAVLALWHSNAWAIAAGMAIAGIGSGCTYAVIPQMVVQQVPKLATSSALSFNMLLRYIGFSIGSALAPVLIAVADQQSGGRDRFTMPFAVAGVFFAGSVIAMLFMRRGRVQE